jgi:hypothetical protein
MLACDSCTTRKWAPFQVGANLEPLYEPLQIVIHLAARSHTCSSNGFPCGAPALVRYFETRRRIRLTTFPILPTQQDFAAPVRLAPVFPPVVLTATYSQLAGEHPATHLLVRASQQLWLINCHGGCTTVHLRCACGTCLAPYTARLLAVSIPSLSPG